MAKPRIRNCEVCGKGYNRRNLTELWTTRKPGSRTGWEKSICKVCNNCLTMEQSKRMLTYIDVGFKVKSSNRIVLK